MKGKIWACLQIGTPPRCGFPLVGLRAKRGYRLSNTKTHPTHLYRIQVPFFKLAFLYHKNRCVPPPKKFLELSPSCHSFRPGRNTAAALEARTGMLGVPSPVFPPRTPAPDHPTWDVRPGACQGRPESYSLGRNDWESETIGWESAGREKERKRERESDITKSDISLTAREGEV